MSYPESTPAFDLATSVGSLSAASEVFIKLPNGAEKEKARLAMLAQMRAITTSLTDPMHRVMQQTSSMTELICTRTIMDMGVLENLPEKENEFISLSQLATRTNAQASLLGQPGTDFAQRLMRILIPLGFIQQDAAGGYAHTEHSRAYLSKAGLWFSLMYDNVLIPMADLPRYVSEHAPHSEPTSITRNPMTWHYNAEGTNYWDVMARFPGRIETFQKGLAMQQDFSPVTGFYDYGTLKLTPEEEENGRVMMVDVAGGRGTSIEHILKAHPDLNAKDFVLQDLPEILELARKEGHLPREVSMIPVDFWKGQPVKGAKAYYVRRITHDYSDAANIQILKHIADAMAHDSVLLIDDVVVPDRCTEADIPVAFVDLAVMGMGGKERKESEFRTLFDAVGLKLVKTWRAGVGSQAITEATKKAV